MGHPELQIEDAVNETRWSGKPVAADSLTTYKKAVVGFRNPGYRDKFDKAVAHFEDALTRKMARALTPGL
jgi:hypothetical protein